jgi:phosphoenolpyruvate synthase/pyruvate phosphate dikinase
VTPAATRIFPLFPESSLERPRSLARQTAHVRPRQSRRQERLLGRDDRQPGPTRRVRARRLRDDRAGVPGLPRKSGLAKRIQDRLSTLDVEDVDALAVAGPEIRGWIIDTALPADLDQAIRDAYAKLCADAGAKDIAVAVRSSATAEDLPDASFAGQQETFLNVSGIEDVLHKVKEVFASLYNDRAIAYRVHHGFKHEDVFLSAGVQLMVRSDVGAAGVLFTLDTESGFRDAVFVTGSYGLGEMVVQGAVNPDEFYVYKPTLKPASRRSCAARSAPNSSAWSIRRRPASA